MSTVAQRGQIAGTSATAVFTVPTGEVFNIVKLTLRDEAGSSQTCDVHIAQDGGAAAASNRIDDVSVSANSTVTAVSVLSHRMAAGAKLYLTPSVGTLNWFLSGATSDQPSRDAASIG